MTRCDAGYDARDGACDDAYVSHRRVTPTVAATVQWFHQLSAKSIELKDLRPSGPAPPHTPQAQSLLTFCSSHVVAYLGYDKDTLISRFGIFDAAAVDCALSCVVPTRYRIRTAYNAGAEISHKRQRLTEPLLSPAPRATLYTT